MFPSTSVKCFRGFSRPGGRKRRGNRARRCQISPNNASPASVRVWKKSYENILQWQIWHKANFWRDKAEKLQKENNELKQRLKYYEEMEEMELELSLESGAAQGSSQETSAKTCEGQEIATSSSITSSLATEDESPMDKIEPEVE